VSRGLLALGALFAALAVGAGAFAAHGLRGVLPGAALALVETAARYQMYHALGMLAAGLWPRPSRLAAAAGVLFAAGIVLFSGSLYALALSGARGLGAITPLGGAAFIAGWLALAAAALARR